MTCHQGCWSWAVSLASGPSTSSTRCLSSHRTSGRVGGEEELLSVDLAARGWGLAYVDEVVAHHHPSPSRDPSGRRRVQVRNALWSAWLRRPLGGAARRTAHVAVQGMSQPGVLAGVLAAMCGLPWVLRERRPVRPELEAALRSLHPGGAARRHPRPEGQPGRLSVRKVIE